MAMRTGLVALRADVDLEDLRPVVTQGECMVFQCECEKILVWFSFIQIDLALHMIMRIQVVLHIFLLKRILA